MMDDAKVPNLPSIHWRIGYCLLALAVFAVGAALGDSDRGTVAAFSFAAVVLAARIRWDLRHQAWFQVLVAVFVVVHLAAALLVSWRIAVHPTILLAPIVIADFAVMVWLIFAVEKIARRW